MKKPTIWLGLFFTMSACSFTAIQRVPSNYTNGSQDIICTNNLTYPLIDMTGTVLSGVLTISLISSDNAKKLKTGAYMSTGMALAFVTSAIYGLYQVNRCRNASNTLPVLPATPPPSKQDPPGTHGGMCLEDGGCNFGLTCDIPMQVCLPDENEGSP